MFKSYLKLTNYPSEMKLGMDIKYNWEMLGKKPEPPAGIEPTTFQMPVRRSNHWAMGDSYGE